MADLVRAFDTQKRPFERGEIPDGRTNKGVGTHSIHWIAWLTALFDGWLANGRHVIVGSKFVTKGNPPHLLADKKIIWGDYERYTRNWIGLDFNWCLSSTNCINQSIIHDRGHSGTCSEIRYIIWKNGEMNLLLVIQVISLSDWRLKEVGF